MLSDFLVNIYGMLFEPKKTIERLSENPPVVQSVVLVLLMAVFLNVVFFGVHDNAFTFLLLSVWLSITAIVSWIVVAAFYELVASIFVSQSHYKAILTLFAFCTLPWIFIAPLELLKSAGVLGSLLGIYLELAIWVWSGVLMFLSIKKVYELKSLRAFVFLMLPFIAGFISFNLFLSFVVNIIKIFS